MTEPARIEISDHAPHVLVVDDDRRLRGLLEQIVLSENFLLAKSRASGRPIPTRL